MLYRSLLLALLLTGCELQKDTETDTRGTGGTTADTSEPEPEPECADIAGEYHYTDSDQGSDICATVTNTGCSFYGYNSDDEQFFSGEQSGDSYTLWFTYDDGSCTSTDFESWSCEAEDGAAFTVAMTPGCDTIPVDVDADGVTADEDCDDSDASTYPGADELCDGADNDCDGDIDEEAVDASVWYVDTDDDGQGDTSDSLEACAQPEGYVDNSDDPYPLDPFEGARLVRMHPGTDGRPSALRYTAQETGSATVRVTAGLARDECGSNDGINIILYDTSGHLLMGDLSTAGGDYISYEDTLSLTAGDTLTLAILTTGDNYCDWGSAAFTVEQGDRLYDAGYDYSTDKGQQGYKGWQYMYYTSALTFAEMVPAVIGADSTKLDGWMSAEDASGAQLYQSCSKGDLDCDGIADTDDTTPDDAHQP